MLWHSFHLTKKIFDNFIVILQFFFIFQLAASTHVLAAFLTFNFLTDFPEKLQAFYGIEILRWELLR